MSAVCSWDSSIHDSVHLNRITSSSERIYLIIKATVQLSHPASMELVLRKRIAVNIYNKQVNISGIRPNQRVESLWFTHFFDFCLAEFYSESQAKDIFEEHTLFMWCDLWDCFQYTKGSTKYYLTALSNKCCFSWSMCVVVDDHQPFSALVLFLSHPGLRGARGKGNFGPDGCSWGLRGHTGWRNLHREVHTGSPASGEHPQSGETTTGILRLFCKKVCSKSFIYWAQCKDSPFFFFSFKAVTVKEALTAKGRLLRRSVSTPNVQHVMHTSVTALPREPWKIMLLINITLVTCCLSCSPVFM